MGLLDTLFNFEENKIIMDPEKVPQHSVIITFNYGLDDICYLHELETKLSELLDSHEVGYWDGHELAMDNSDGILYFYGPNAEALFKVMKPILDSTDFLEGAIANLRFGPHDEGVSEIDVVIGENC
jgi:hypothetical protein